jgi:tight adherence protein C
MKESALKVEFSRALREIKYGKSFEGALVGIANRVKLPDVNFFVNTVNHAHRMGVDISEVIREQAKDIRIRHRQKSEEAAAKASTKLIFPLVICVLPILFILLIGPLIIRIIENLAAVG